MKSFAGSSMVKYMRYLKKEVEWNAGLYCDPDGDFKGDFYNKLIKFLNARENQVSLPTKFSYRLSEENSESGRYIVPPSIEVLNNSAEHVMYLRSDQFGFSAPYGNNLNKGAWKPVYPYGKYLVLGGSSLVVAETVYSTRTIGGSFLWPILYGNKPYFSGKCWWNPYNYYRGNGDYIEDRVDLTLYEIYMLYSSLEQSETLANANDSIVLSETKIAKLEKAEREKYFLNLKVWFEHFGSFKNYIEFFILMDFVNDDYFPIDLFTNKVMNENTFNEYKHGKKKYIQNESTIDELEMFFIELCKRTYSRSSKIDNIIQKECDDRGK